MPTTSHKLVCIGCGHVNTPVGERNRYIYYGTPREMQPVDVYRNGKKQKDTAICGNCNRNITNCVRDNDRHREGLWGLQGVADRLYRRHDDDDDYEYDDDGEEIERAEPYVAKVLVKRGSKFTFTQADKDVTIVVEGTRSKVTKAAVLTRAFTQRKTYGV